MMNCPSSLLPLSPADNSRSSKSDGAHETEDNCITDKDQKRGAPSAESPQRRQGRVMAGQEDCLEEVTSVEDLKALPGWFERKAGAVHPKEG